MVRSRKHFFRRKSSVFLLILFSIVGIIGDYIYAVFYMRGIHLPISPGEILRGGVLFILLIMLIMGQLKVPRSLLFALAFFLLIALVYGYLGEEGASTRGERRIFFVVKLMFLVLMVSLIYEILNRGELSAEALTKYLVGWVLIFHIVPIIMANYGIIGYDSYRGGYRVGYKGLISAQNSVSVILVSTFPFMAIPKTVLASFGAIAGFLACELVGTKAAAAGGFLAPLLLLLLGVFHRRLNTWIIVSLGIVFLGLFLFKDAIFSIQAKNFEYYSYSYNKSESSIMMLSTGRAIYYYQLPEFLNQNKSLTLLMGSPRLCFNELDHLAMLSRFGIIGLIVYIVIFIQGIKICLSLMRKGWFEAKVAVALLAVLVHSFLGGHVIANAVTAFPVAVVIGMAIYLYEKVV